MDRLVPGRGRDAMNHRAAQIVCGLLMLSLVGVVGLLAAAQPPPSRSAGGLPLFDGHRADGYPAISLPSQTLSLAFMQPGIVQEVFVQEGQRVGPGEALVRLDDQIQRLTVDAQRLVAEDDSQLLAARRRLELARYDLENIRDLDRRGATNPRELERAQVEEALRDIDVTASERTREQARLIYEREAAVLERMTLRSRIDGVVARVDVEPGKSAEALRSVVHVVAIDPLWMDVAVPVQLALFIEPESIAIIRWRDVPATNPIQGRVLWISPIADASANTMTVRLELDNTDGLPAGLHSLVQFPEADEALRRAAR
jgi:RND family efflux transporter MFP subunit